jgi:polysaccharide chain length determinant protein (PEP-CTERM system associated)
MLPGKKYSPANLIDIAWRSRWLIVVPLVTCSFAALVVSAILPDVYESDMLVQIIPQRVPDSYVRSTVTLKAEDRINAVAQQVMSRTQLEQMIRELDLYRQERTQFPMEDVVEKMRSAIVIDLVRRSGNMSPVDAFHVKFRYNDAAMATRVTQRLGTLFIDHNARDRGTLAEATNAFLETQLTQARVELEGQERKLEHFRQQHAGQLPSNLDFNMQTIQSTQMQVQSLVESLARDRDRKMMLERLYNDAQSEPLPVAPAATNSGAPQPEITASGTPKQQLELAKATLARLELRLKPEHPDILRTRRLIADLEKKVDAEPKDAPKVAAAAPTDSPTEVARRERFQQMRAEMESLDRQIAFKDSEEARLRAKIADYQRRIEAVPGTESEWTALSRDYETLQNAYRQLLTKSEESKVAADLERRQIGEQFRVLDVARVPVRPVSPNRLQVNAVGVGLGLFIGLGLLALIELRDSSFRSEADVFSSLALPVLAVVPYVESDEDRSRAVRRRWLVSVGATVAISAGGYVFWAMKLWKHVV